MTAKATTPSPNMMAAQRSASAFTACPSCACAAENTGSVARLMAVAPSPSRRASTRLA